MPCRKTVTAARYFKTQIPAEIFLTVFFFSLYALFGPFIDSPLRHIVSETTRIDEILFWLGHVENLNMTTVLISEVMVPKMILTLRKNQVRHRVEISNNGRKATCRKEV
jgi:hypothetical protein